MEQRGAEEYAFRIKTSLLLVRLNSAVENPTSFEEAGINLPYFSFFARSIKISSRDFPSFSNLSISK